MRRLAAVLALTVAAGCASSTGPDSGAASANVGDDVVAVGAAPPPSGGGLTEAVETAAGAPSEADTIACSSDRRTLELAVETFALLEGAPPAGQDELVDAQLIAERSSRYDVTATGAVVPAPGSPCA